MPDWPAQLPQSPLIEGYQESEPDNIIASEVDVGPPKTRLRTTSNPKKVQCTFYMSLEEKTIFIDFFRNTLSYGALPFTWIQEPTDPLSGLTASWMFDPQERERVRISPSGLKFDVECKLLRLA